MSTRRAHTLASSWSPPTARQPRPHEAVEAQDVAGAAEMRTGALQGSDSGSVKSTDPGSPPRLKKHSANGGLLLTQQAAGPGLAKHPAAPRVRQGATGKSKT